MEYYSHIMNDAVAARMSKKYQALFKKFYVRADVLCKKYPSADREIIVQTFVSLLDTPTERMRRALIRGQKISPNRK